MIGARTGRRLLAVVAVLAACLLVPAAACAAAGPVRLLAGFGPGARLGSPSSLSVGLRIDPARLGSELTEFHLLYPASLGVATSGLGLETCTRPAEDFQKVIISGRALGGCSPNAVMGYGSARAQMRLDTLTVPETALLTMLAAPQDDGSFGLLFYADGQNPLGMRLALSGRILPARAPFGGDLTISIPPVPQDLFGPVSVGLVQLDLAIGTPDIVYYEQPTWPRAGAFRPEGIALPERCPRGHFRFRAKLAFADGRRVSTDTVLRCPRSTAAAAGRSGPRPRPPAVAPAFRPG